MNRAMAGIEFGSVLDLAVANGTESGGATLENRFGIPRLAMGIPIGAKATDRFFTRMEEALGLPTPEKYKRQRGRLIDAYVDGNKYVSKKRAVIYGEEDFVAALAGFLAEVGIIPVLCATGGNSGLLAQTLRELIPRNILSQVSVHHGMDFAEMEQSAKALKPDFIMGNSKGYAMARNLGLPLVRAGFPVHDRVGGSRILHIGYKGTQQLFDTIINTLLQYRQENSHVGYAYM